MLKIAISELASEASRIRNLGIGQKGKYLIKQRSDGEACREKERVSFQMGFIPLLLIDLVRFLSDPLLVRSSISTNGSTTEDLRPFRFGNC